MQNTSYVAVVTVVRCVSVLGTCIDMVLVSERRLDSLRRPPLGVPADGHPVLYLIVLQYYPGSRTQQAHPLKTAAVMSCQDI